MRRRWAWFWMVAAFATPAIAITAPLSWPVHAAVSVTPSISSSETHNLVLRADGSVWSFGSNSKGQLGVPGTVFLFPTETPNPVPVNVPGLSDVTQVSAGGLHSLALRADGTVWAWGDNEWGQLGRTTNNGTIFSNATPTQVPDLSGVVAVSAGFVFSLVLRSDGTVWGFGANHFGQLGNATNPTNTTAPIQVDGLTDVTAIAAGGNHSLALRADGTVWSFGDNFHGELGVPTNSGTSIANPVATQIPGLSNVTAISASYSSLALRSDGTVWAFGDNSYGQLGINNGMGIPNPVPSQVPGVSSITAISAGASHSLLLRSDGATLSFGGNFYGELGTDATSFANPTPTVVPGLPGVVDIAAARNHSLVLGNDGVVYAFGSNMVGQLGSPANSGFNVKNPRPAPASLPSRFVGVVPTRVLDTRPETAVNYAGEKPGALSSTVVRVVGRAGVPANAVAVSGNVTATEATEPGFVQARHTDFGNLGKSSNVNVERAGQTIANAVIVPIGVDGSITLFSQPAAHLVLDVTGYFVPVTGPVAAGRLIPVTPTRLFDTRPGTAVNYSGPQPGIGSITRVQITGLGPVPASGVAAVVLNVTATEAAGSGYIQVAPAGSLVPGASSNINLDEIGQTSPNQVIVTIGTGGGIEIFESRGADLIVDVAGYITDNTATPGTAGLFVPIAPTRAIDTRPEFAVNYTGPKPNSRSLVTVNTNLGGIPTEGVSAVAANVTITEATAAGFVQAAATGTLVRGTSSILNANSAGQTIPNAAIIPVANGQFDLYTQSGGHLIADISGYFTT